MCGRGAYRIGLSFTEETPDLLGQRDVSGSFHPEVAAVEQ